MMAHDEERRHLGVDKVAGIKVPVENARAKHGNYTCWLGKMCGHCWGSNKDSKFWRITILLTVLSMMVDLSAHGASYTDSFNASVAVVSFVYDPLAHDARLATGLVVGARHFSFSWNQLGKFIDVCAEAYVSNMKGTPPEKLSSESQLVKFGLILVQLGLIQVAFDRKRGRWCAVDGPRVLLVNQILVLGDQKTCKLTAELFLMIFFFFGVGDDNIRAQCTSFIYAACFYGAISMSYVQTLGPFFMSYQGLANDPRLRMPFFEIISASGAEQDNRAVKFLKFLGSDEIMLVLDEGFASNVFARDRRLCDNAYDEQRRDVTAVFASATAHAGMTRQLVVILGASAQRDRRRGSLSVRIDLSAVSTRSQLRSTLWPAVAVAFAYGAWSKFISSPLLSSRLPAFVTNEILRKAVYSLAPGSEDLSGVLFGRLACHLVLCIVDAAGEKSIIKAERRAIMGIGVSLDDELKDGFDALYDRATGLADYREIMYDLDNNGNAERHGRRILELQKLHVIEQSEAFRVYAIEQKDRAFAAPIMARIDASRAESEARRVERFEASLKLFNCALAAALVAEIARRELRAHATP